MSGKLVMGRASYGYPVLFGEKNNVYVGKYCSIAQDVHMDCGLNHNYDNLTTFPFNTIYPDKFKEIDTHPISRGDIIIGNDVWIGKDVTIMSGVTIGDGAIIGTKSLITKDVEPYSIVGGVPAKHIRYRYDQDTIAFLLRTKWWDFSESEVFGIVPILMSSNMNKLREYFDEREAKMYKGYRIAFYTRSMNEDLYLKMKSLFNNKFDFVRITDCHGVEGAVNYIYKAIFDDKYDYVINIDEDMFIYGEDKIFSLLDYMIENDYDYCGMPDGGVCTHRFHSPIVMNPFFNIFNSRKIREAIDIVSYVNSFIYTNDMEKYIPMQYLKPKYAWKNDNFEPFYPFFYWLPVRGFKPLYLKSYEYEDGAIFEKGNPNNGLSGISTIIKNQNDEEIGIHTWYSRVYGKDQFHTTRIDNAYELAKSKQPIIINVDVVLSQPVKEIKLEAVILRDELEKEINNTENTKANDLDLSKLDITPTRKNTRKSK